MKLINPQHSSKYIERLHHTTHHGLPTWTSMFHYDEWGRKVYWLTRQIKGLRIDSQQYRSVFHSQLVDDFAPILVLFMEHGFLSTTFELSMQGRYFADSMAGLLVEYISTKKTGEKLLYSI